MAYGPTQYGPPPQQPYGAPMPQYGPPPAGGYGPPPAPIKKKSLGLFIGIGAGALLLVGLGIGAGLFFWMRSNHAALPVEANLLPTDTKTIGTHVIDSTREKDEHVKSMYLASELGALCTGGSGLFDAARRIESLGSGDPKSAKDIFFNKTALDDIKTQLDCGAQMAKALQDPKASYLLFEDDDNDKKFRNVSVLKLKMSELPSDAGFSHENFGNTPGFCKPGPPPSLFAPLPAATSTSGSGSGSGSAPALKCEDNSRGAFAVGNTWFFGTKDSLEGMAEAVKHPKKDLGTNAAALKDAAAEMQGLPSVRIVAQPKSSKDFFMGACEWGAYQSGMPIGDFKEGCFPEKGEDNLIEQIDAKVRAAGWEADGDYAKAGAIVANMVLVMRDTDAAKDAEHSVNELVRDWKAHLDMKSAKVIKDTKDKAKSARQKEFAAIVDSYFTALSKSKVSRDGRVIKIAFKENLTKEDKQSLIDANGEAVEKRQATADILEAIQGKRPLPVASLTKLVGKSWATYLSGPPPATAALPGTLLVLSETECDSVKTRLQSIQLSDLPSKDTAVTDAYIKQKYAVCSIDPPKVSPLQKPCLLTFSNAADYAKCTSSSDPREPPSSEYGKDK